jgi:hypothetical protein
MRARNERAGWVFMLSSAAPGGESCARAGGPRNTKQESSLTAAGKSRKHLFERHCPEFTENVPQGLADGGNRTRLAIGQTQLDKTVTILITACISLKKAVK